MSKKSLKTNETIDLLKIGKGSNNAKLAKLEAKLGCQVYTFSLPAGYTCPGSSLCKSRFDRKLGKIVDGELQEFRCFAASMESAFKGFRESNDHNWALLKRCADENAMVELMVASVRAQVKPGSVMRIHVSGDFYNAVYFKAWMRAAAVLTDIRFYAYTKSVHILAQHIAMVPSNFRITCSEGGKFDALIAGHGLRSAKVVFSIEEASVLGIGSSHLGIRIRTDTRRSRICWKTRGTRRRNRLVNSLRSTGTRVRH